MMFARDTPEDLVLRGYTQDAIMSLCGVDVGYRGRKYRDILSGIDRFQYKVAYVKERQYDIVNVLEKYESGISVEDLLLNIGIGSRNGFSLRKMFAALGYEEEFIVSDKKRKHTLMTKGFELKYETDNPFKLQEFQEKGVRTRVEKYGGEYTLSAGSSLSLQARKTFVENMRDKSYREGVVSKRKETCEQHYGVPVPLQSQEVQMRLKATCLKTYGADSYSKTDEFKTRMSDSSAIWVPKMFATKKSKGNLNTSCVENYIANELSGFEREYVSERYPYHSDFYDSDRNLFIEVNAHWTHGGHWCDTFSAFDAQKLGSWQEKSSSYIDKAIKTWTVSDVSKRQCARDNKLNYVTFWDSQGSDFDLWLAMGMPDGQDWRQEYSWLPIRELTVGDGDETFQKLWNENPPQKDWGFLQVRCYIMCYKYWHKLPAQLSDADILRALDTFGFCKDTLSALCFQFVSEYALLLFRGDFALVFTRVQSQIYRKPGFPGPEPGFRSGLSGTDITLQITTPSNIPIPKAVEKT